jgi:hypothetical protein
MLAGNDKAAQAEALKAANAGWTRPPSSPTPPAGGVSMPTRPPMPGMPQMPMGMTGSYLEPGDPVNRNTRND